MNWINKLDRKYGKYGIENLPKYLAGFKIFTFILIQLNPSFANVLSLNIDKVMNGEIWRLFTYIFLPGSYSFFWFLINVYVLFALGSMLEQHWGSFKFTMYYLVGMIGTTIGALVISFAYPGMGAAFSGSYIDLSILLAFATLYGDHTFLLFFVIPVKAKYLAYIQFFFIAQTVLTQPIPYKVLAIVSIVNYFLFFGLELFTGPRVSKRTKKFKEQHLDIKYKQDTAVHKCEVCGITEKDDPTMEFRYCSKCEGLHEYCMRHINDHTHK